jgi:hypothetical protein
MGREQFAQAFARLASTVTSRGRGNRPYGRESCCDKIRDCCYAVNAATLHNFCFTTARHGRNAFLAYRSSRGAFQGCPGALPMNPYKMVRLLRPTLGMLASSKALAEWRSSILRKPAFAKARAAPSGRPLRSQAFEASQYSSNDEGLRLMSDNSPPIRLVS